MASGSLQAAAAAALLQCWSILSARAATPPFLALLQEIFHAPLQDAADLSHQLAAGPLTGLTVSPSNPDDLGPALGAYSPGDGLDAPPTILISAALLQPGRDERLLQRVLLEEIGHHIDHLLNGTRDTAGDEGQLFAARLLADPLTPLQLAAIATEDDRGTAWLNGQTITVERSTDTTRPTVASIALTAEGSQNGLLAAGDTVHATVSFSEPVSVTGSPSLRLRIGTRLVNATYNPTTTPTELRFSYVIDSGLLDANGISVPANSILLPQAAAIKDSAGNDAILSHALIADSDTLRVDALVAPPLITSLGGSDRTVTLATDDNVVRGTAEPLATITLSGNGTTLGTAAADANGQWSYLLTPANITAIGEGSGRTITATALDRAGNTSAPSAAFVVAVNTSPTGSLSAPTITSAGGEDRTISSQHGDTLVTGTALPGSKVSLYAGTSTTPLATVTAAADGSWRTTIAQYRLATLTQGALRLTAKASRNGASSPLSTPFDLTLDTSRPLVSSIRIIEWEGRQNGLLNAGDRIAILATLSEPVLLSGTGTPQLQLRIGTQLVAATYDADNSTATELLFRYTIAAAQLDSNGISIPANSITLPNGTTLSDAAGNPALLSHAAVADDSAYKVDTTVAPPQITQVGRSDQTVTLAAGDALVEGTAEAGSTVTIRTGATVLGTATAGSDRQWRYALSADDLALLGDGINKTILAVATDLAGNQSSESAPFSFAVSTLPAAAPQITAAGSTARIINLDAGNAAISGTASAGAVRVLLYADGTEIASAQVTQGSWSYRLSPEELARLSQGRVDLTARAIDAGNTVSDESEPFTVAIDTLRPFVSAIAIVEATGDQDGLLNAGDRILIRCTLSESVTVIGQPRLNLLIGSDLVQAIYEPASSTGRELDFSYLIQAAQIDADGISIPANALSLPTGASITDAAGHGALIAHGPVQANAAYRVDTAIAPPVITAVGGDDRTVTAAAADALVSGTAESGAEIILYTGNSRLGRTTADQTGAWTYILNSDDLMVIGEGANRSITAIASDQAGNSSTPSAPFAFALYVHTAPAITIGGISDATLAENSAYSSATPTVTGAVGSVTWALLPGDDAALFAVDTATGVVTLAARDFENPADSAATNTYRYTLKATDSLGNTATRTVAVAITNVNETATLTISNLANGSVAENSTYTSTTPVLTGALGAVTWKLEGEDAARFSVNASTGVVSMLAPDFEAPVDTGANNTYSYTLKASDSNGNTTSRSVLVTVTNVNEPSTISIGNLTNSTIAENTPYTSTSPNITGALGSVTWSLEGEDAGKFTVNASNGVVSMVARDFEAPADTGSNNSYTYTLRATDSNGNTSTRAVVVTVTNVTESAVLTISNISSSSLAENNPYISNTPNLTGAIGTVSWSLEGEDAARFTVNASTGVVSMVARDFEAPADTGSNNTYSYSLRATDSEGNTATKDIVVILTNVNETATLSIGNLVDSTIGENSSYTSTTPSISGAIGTVTWSLEGEDASRFTVNANTGVVSMNARDFEAPVDTGASNTYSYTLKASDSNGNSVTKSVVVTVTDVTEASTLTISNIADTSIAENIAYASGTPSVTGPIGTVTWSLEGEDADKFSVNANTGMVSMVARDFEAPADTGSNNTYSYSLRATDSDGNTAVQAVVVTVTDVAIEGGSALPPPFTAVRFSPADGGVDIALEHNLILEFTRPIVRGTGTIELRSGSATGPVVESFNAASSTRLTLNDTTLTIDPSADLSANTRYFLVVPSGAVHDAQGNAFSGTSTWDFTTVSAVADLVAPTITTSSPASGATAVTLGSNLTITFSEAIRRGSGTIELRSGSASGALVESFDASTSSRFSINGNTLTLDPSADLSSTTTYAVVFAAGSIQDLAGNNFAGSASYSFSTTAALTISAVNDNVGASQGDVANGASTEDTTPTLSGTLPAALSTGQSLRVLRNGAFVDTATVTGTSWTYTPTTPLTAGGHSFSVALVDAGGTTLALSAPRSVVVTLSIGGLADQALAENTGYTSGTPTASGAIGPVTWSLEGEDASRFTVNASTGVVSMVARDYEVPVDVGANNSYNYTLKATDKAGNTATQAVAISITNSTSGDNSPPTGEVLITGAYQSGQTLKASSFIRYNSYLTGTATRISTAGTVADFDPINSTFVMEGGWVGVDSNDTRGAAAIVRNVDTSVAGQLTFWVMAFDDNKTKAVQVRLANMSGGGVSAQALAAKDTTGDQRSTTFNFDTGGNFSTLATSDSADGLGVRSSNWSSLPALSDLDGVGTLQYQWYADGVAISGATGRSYTLTSNEIGKTVNLRVSYTDSAGKSEVVETSPQRVQWGTTSSIGSNLLLSNNGSNLQTSSGRNTGSVLATSELGDVVVYSRVDASAITLNAGQTYYIEVHHLEGSGGDHVAVGWKLPGASTITDVTGTFTEQRWSGATAYNNQDWSATPTATSSLTTLATAQGVGDNYSRRIVGTFTAPTSGTYTFYIASDDGSRLYLGTSSDPSSKGTDPIATVPDNGYTGYKEWTKFPSQAGTSVSVSSFIAVDSNTGTNQILNRSVASGSSASSTPSEFKGISADGRYAVLAVSQVSGYGNGTAFTDTNSVTSGISDLIVFDRTTGTVKLATWSADQTTSNSQNASFLGITSNSQYLIYRTDFANKIGSFTRSGITDGTASADLIAYNLATGVQTLLTHGTLAGQSLGAGIETAMLSNDGQFVLFTAKDGTKLGQGASTFTDNAPTVADLYAVRISDGDIRLLSRAMGESNVTASTPLTLLGQSGDGAYAVIRAADTSKFGLIDSNPNTTDLLSINIATGAIRPLNHPTGNSSTTTNSNPTFVAAIGDYVYFTVQDATTLSVAADGSTTKNDLFRTHVATGEVRLLSRDLTDSTKAMDGNFVPGSLVVSSNDRYVAFTSSVPTSAGGDAVFVVDTQTNTIKQVNGGYSLWGGARPNTFADGDSKLVISLQSAGWLGQGFTGDDGQKAIVSYDFLTNTYSLLSHNSTLLNKSFGSAATYRGISADGKTVYFTAADATKFGNSGTAFTDSNTTADDVFAVNVTTGVIELVSGINGASLGTAGSFAGTTALGDLLYTSGNVNNLTALSGVMSDSSTSNSDLVASRFALLDLATVSDSKGGEDGSNTDNVTTKRDLILRARVAANQVVQLLDNGAPIATGQVTADSQGVVNWTLTNVALGSHSYSLIDSTTKAPLQLGTRTGSGSLMVVVKADTTGPSLLSSTPSNGASAVAVGANIVLTFSEAIQKGTGSVRLYSTDSSSPALSFDVGSDAISLSGTTLTVNPPADLSSSKTYYITIDPGAITDLSGNAFSGINDPLTVRFKTPDTAAPIFTSAAKAQVLERQSKIYSAVANDSVSTTNGKVVYSLKAATGDVTQLAINANTGDVSLKEGVSSAAVKGQYSFTVIATDAVGNASEQAIVVTVDPSPALVSSNPSDNAVSVSALGNNIVITFSEPVQQNLRVAEASTQGRFVRIELAGESKQIALSELQVLSGGVNVALNKTATQSSTEYWSGGVASRAVDGSLGSNEILTDRQANPFWEVDLGSSYTIEAINLFNSKGYPKSLAGATLSILDANRQLIDQRILPAEPGALETYTFQSIDSRTIRLYSQDGVLIQSFDTSSANPNITVSGNTLSINPSADLQANTGYYLLIDPQAIRDQGGNTFAGLSTTSQLNFRTGAPDTTAPSLVTSNPTDGRSDFGVGQNLSFTFSEAIEAGFGFLNLYRADGTLVEGFDLASSSRALFSGKTLTINPTWALESGLEHYIQIANGAIRDVSGNLYAGVSDNITLNFLTAPESWNDTAEAFTRDNFPGNTIESIGDHRMLLFRVAFADQSIAPWYSYSSGYVNDVQLTDVFWAKGSYGRMSLSSTETPLIKLNQTWNFVRDVDAGDGVDANNPFSDDFGNNLGNIHEQAVKAAQRLGYNVNNYDVRVAGNSQWTRRGASWGGGNFVWNGWDGFSTLAHEAGHALGFGHANWLRPDGVVGEYGNIFDIMGNGGSVDSDYWIKQKLDVGWLNPSQIATNPQSGSYRIYAHDEGVALNDQLYGLAVGGTRKYYLEYRNQLSEGRLSKALLVVRDDDSLIDALPVTPDNNAHPYAGIDIARTYKIPDQDTYITVLAQGDGYLDVAVRNGPFSSNVNPTASFTATASQVKTRDSITFSATGADSNGDELVYAWWFSDNVAGSGATFTRTFDQATAGTITAKLIVSDLKGGTATVEQAIAVAAASTANPVTVGALTSLSTSKPLVSIQASDAFATEGTSDTASLLISRFGTALTNPLTVKLTYSGSALNQVAAGSLPATVTIAANQRSVSVPISFLDNATLEAVRQLTVNVAADSAYDVSVQNTTAVINLFDNDRTVVSIEAVDKIASENGRDSAAFRISRTGSTTEALKVYYSAYGTAYNGSDYQTLNGEITILAGESAAVVLIQPVNDGVGEQTETVNLILSSISTAYDVNRKAASASIALLDNDAPLVSLYADSYTKTSILEGSTTPARFVVMATGRPGSTVSVDYTIAGTATSGVDYTAPSSSVSITIGKDGLGKSTIEIPIINDTTQEVLETIQIALKESPSYQIDSNNAATFVINDNDSAGPIVMVSPFMDTQVEGGTTTTGDYRNGQGRFYISRNTDDNRPVNTGTLTVSYTISGTASPGSDFTGLTTGTVTIPDGAPGAIVRFTPVDDAIGEGSESVVLTINSSSSYRIGASGSAAMWIDDNDTAAITVGFESLFSRVSETQDSLLSVRDVVVKLSGASATPISVTAVAGGGTATGDGVDWTFLDPVTNKPVSTPTITFAPGETSKILRLQAIADAEIEINEVAQIDLIRPTNATLTSGAQSHSLFMDDAPAGGDQANRYVRLLTTGSVLRESAGADPMLMVALDRPAGATPITVELQLGGTALRGSDFNLTATTLTFQPGEVSKAVPLTLLNDALAEAPESIQIGITRASGAIVSGPPVHEIVLVDANAPTIQSAKAWVNGAPAAGTIVTTVSATPASGRTISGWQIMSGNAIRDGQANPAFSITNSGQVVIANTNSLPIGPTAIQLVVRATDNQGAANDNIVSLVVNGQRVFEETRWLGTAPFDNQDWSETPIYRGALSTSASASNVDDSYSRRITGLLEPTTTGDYTFWVAGDDRARLYLGSDQSEASKQQIAMTPDWTNADQFTKYPEQQSRTVRLEAGQRYWLEAQQVEASVGDHVAIAWQGPGMASRALITEANLAPIIPGMLTEQELKAAATYKPAVQTATISSVIGTDSGLTSTINSGSRTRDRSLALSGTVDAGSTVQIFDGTTLLGKATVTGNTWNFSTPELVDGTHNLVAQVVDQVGNVRITPAVEALVNSQIELGANRLLSPSSSNALSTSNSAVGSVLGSDASGSLLVVEQVKTINLVAGQTYYIEVQHLEGGGGDHVEAGWKLPGASSITSITGSFTEKRWSGPNAYNTQTWSGTPSYTGSLTTLASAVGVGDDYSRLITGTFVAPVSGNYTFFLASDDQSRLYLGTGSTADTKDPSPIATVNDWANINEWTKSPSQQGSRYPSSTVYELLDTATGTRTLINRSATSTSQAALATSEYKGISADGRYVVFAATDVSRFGNSGTTFTDSNTVSSGMSDLPVFDRTTNTVKLATWSGNQTTSLSQQASFVGITSDNQYLVYKSDYANKIGSFTRSGITDATASTDLIAYNLSTGALSLITHGSTASQSLGAGVSNAVLSNDGQYVLFTANDASKLANAGTAFTDASPTTADLFAARITDGSINLLSRGTSSATTGAGTAVTLLGQSADGTYAIISTADASKFGLTDTNITSNDLLAINITSGAITALNHSNGSNTTTTASDPTFIAAIGDYAYFTVRNATTMGATADGSATKADLYRTQISSGAIKLLSFQSATPSAAMDGSYVSNSLVVSSDDRYVAFTSDVPTSAGGGAVFVVDTLASTIKQVNASYTQWGDARAQAFAIDNNSLIFTTRYTGYLGGFGSKSDNEIGIFKFNISTGAISLLSHSATSSTYVAGSATFRGISGDSKTVYFTASDASQFGNNGSAFIDSAPAADDLFAVDVATGVIELVSGVNGVSLGTAISFEGIGADGQVRYTSANANNLPGSPSGVINDQYPNIPDLIASSFALLDLSTASDSTGNGDGTNRDNITSARTLTLTARVLPNQQVSLLDSGSFVSGTQLSADSNGHVSWTLSNVAIGRHSYSLLDAVEQVPIVLDGRPASSSLVVTVQGNDTTAPTLLSTSPADGSVSVALGSNISLTFSEPVIRGTGAITLRSSSATGTVVETFDAASSTRLSIANATLTVDPTADLSTSTTYYLVIPSGALKDAAGNSYGGTSTYDITTGNLTPDTTAPTLSSTSPALGATTVAVGSNLSLTFSEAVTRGTGTIELRSGSTTGVLVESFNAASSDRLSVSGSTLTVDPTADLAAGTTYVLVIPSGAIKDAAGNIYTGSSSYSFTTAAVVSDTTEPTIAITSNQSSLSAGQIATISFTLSEVSTDFIADDVTVSGGVLSNFSGSGTSYSAVFTPTANSTTPGVISVGSNRFRDAAANFNNDGNDSNNSVTITINTVVPTTPSSTTTNPPSTTTPAAPVITDISDDATPVTGTVAAGAVTNDTRPTLTITAAAGSTVRVFDHGALLGMATETATAGTFTFTPSADLWASNSHSFTAKASDNAGNLSPASNPYAIAIGVTGDGSAAGPTDLTLTLSARDSHADTSFELVAGGYPKAGTTQDVVFESLDWKLLSGSWSVKAGWNAVDPLIPSLPSGVQFRVKVKSAAGAAGTVLYTSNALNPASSGVVLPAVDNTAPPTPSITGTSSGAGANRPAILISAEAGSSVRVFDGDSLLGTATETSAGAFQFTPNSDLSSGSHTLFARAIDPAGNSSAFSSAFALSIGSGSGTTDTTAPTLTSSSPGDGATAVPIGSNLSLTFSEAVVRGSGTIELRSGAATGTVVESFDAASSSRLSLTGSTLSVDPSSDLNPGTTYYLVIPAGAIKDSAGNSYTGTSSYDVTTAPATSNDTAAPTFVSQSLGAGPVPVASTLELTFSEAVRAGSGNLVLSNGSGDTRTISISDSTQVSFNGTRLILKPTADLNPNSTYNLQLASGVVTDLAGNAFAGISNSSTVSFSTGAILYARTQGTSTSTAGAGTSSSPYESLEHATSVATAGTTIYVEITNSSGTALTGTEAISRNYAIRSNGTASSPILIKPKPGSSDRYVFSAFNGLSVTGSHTVIEGFEFYGQTDKIDYWQLLAKAWEFKGGINDAVYPSGDIAINVTTGQNITIRNNYFHDLAQKAINIESGRYVTISNNIIENVGNVSLSGGHGIMRQQNTGNFGTADTAGQYRWDINGNLIFNVEQRIYSWVPSKGYINMTLDEGKPINIDETTDTQLQARISENVIAYASIDAIRIKPTPNLEISNNSIYSDGAHADGITSINTLSGTTNTPFPGLRVTGNLVQTASGTSAYDISDGFNANGINATSSGNVMLGGVATNTSYFTGVSSASGAVFSNPEQGDFSPTAAAGSAGASAATRASLARLAAVQGVVVSDDNWLIDERKMTQTLLDNLPGIRDGISGNESMFKETGILYANSVKEAGRKAYYFEIDAAWKSTNISNANVLDRTGTTYDNLYEVVTPLAYSSWVDDKLTNYKQTNNNTYTSIRYGGSYIEQHKVFDPTGLTVFSIDSLTNYTQTTTSTGKSIVIDGDALIDISGIKAAGSTGSRSFDLIRASQISSANGSGAFFDSARIVNGGSNWNGSHAITFVDTNNDSILDTLRLNIDL